MPEKITQLPSGKFQVRGPHGIHAKSTSKEKAQSQVRLLNALDHGWQKPKGNRPMNFKDMMKR
jgi:hypothetical protein